MLENSDLLSYQKGCSYSRNCSTTTVMKLPFFLIWFLYIPAALSFSISLSKLNCPEKCGNVTIPYPFGIGSKCSANSSFTIICQNSTHPPTPILSSVKREVVHIYMEGVIIINQPVSPVNCSDEPTKHTLPISLVGTPFSISAEYNTLVNLGCKNSVWLQNDITIVGGCMAICNVSSTDTSCNGVNCCQTTIPHRLQELQYAYQSILPGSDRFCGYVFPVDKEWLQSGYNRRKALHKNMSNPLDKDFGFAPLVLEWEDYNFHAPLDEPVVCTDTDSLSFSSVCNESRGYYPDLPSYLLNWICSDPSRYLSFSSFLYSYDEYAYESTTRYCQCLSGYEGNPYLPGGCTYIDQCENSPCPSNLTCVSTPWSFDYYRHHQARNRIKIEGIVIGSVIGGLILLYGVWRSGNAIRKVIKAIKRYRNYKRNGGLLLEQHLASTDGGLEKTKLYDSKELSKATDHYNEDGILGCGGQGTVYKGMLTDGKIVAVKKSKKVDAADLEVFINEVVILSQVNHRNVVKMLGCCLETEVPLLVYEFIPNGTLFQHIHEPNEELPLTWEMRVRIAAEIAAALSYLHCAASAPIYHRDIKSTNILLDEKYRAKVSDFGTSRSIAIDQTHLTTRVIGTFGYLDPEYFQSSQFTEKSDVYSFGVVMVELLTGEKAVTSIRAESGRSLATHFLHTMEENHLFDIVDARVLEEGRREDIMAMAALAQKCLHLNGRRRPTMKDVAVDLEGIWRGLKEGRLSLRIHDDNNGDPSVELSDELWDLSSISGSINMDTTVVFSKDVQDPSVDDVA